MNNSYIKEVETSNPKEYRTLLREEFIPAMVDKGLGDWVNENKWIFANPEKGHGFSVFPEIAVIFI